MPALAAGAFGGDLGLMDPWAGLPLGGPNADAGYALAAVTVAGVIGGGGAGAAIGVVALAGGVFVALATTGVAGLPVCFGGFALAGICLGGGFANCVAACAGGEGAALAGNGVGGLPVGVALLPFGVGSKTGTFAVAGPGAGLAADVSATGVGLAGFAVSWVGTGSVAGLLGGCTSICLGCCASTVVGVSTCCGELAFAFFISLGMSALLADAAGLGGLANIGVGIEETGAVPGVSGGELGASAVPPGKGTSAGMCSAFGVLGLGGIGGWSAGLLGSVGLPMSCMVCSNFWVPCMSNNGAWLCNMNAGHLCLAGQHGHGIGHLLPLEQTYWE